MALILRLLLPRANFDQTVGSAQLNRFCSSRLETVNLAAQKVVSGWEDLVVAGGVESLSRCLMIWHAEA